MFKRFFSAIVLAGFALSGHAQYQLANAGFEAWESVSYSSKTGFEPVSWSSFLDGTGNLKSMAGYNQVEKSTDVRPGSAGNASAKLTSRAVKLFGITLAVAQGNLTTGCVNMGSTSAKDAKGNYNYINHGREDQAMKFGGHPDAVRVWTKFKGAKTGNVEVALVTDGYYQSPEANEITAKKVAHAQNSNIVSNDAWTEYTIPFTYTEGLEAGVEPEYVLVNISTCAVPGDGKEADYMFVDDFEMIYRSELASAAYDGKAIQFTNGSATVAADYNESLVELVSNGRGATVSKSYSAESGVLTVTVMGENISEDAGNKHVYTIQFNAPKSYTVKGYAVDDSATNAFGNVAVSVQNEADGTKTIVMTGLKFNNTPITSARFTGISFSEGQAFAGTAIVDGNKCNLNGVIIDGRFTAVLDVAVLKEKLYIGYDLAGMEVTSANWATFIAPFDVVLPAGVTAYTVDGVDNLVLKLTDAGSVVAKNTPVVLYSTAAVKHDFFGIGQPSAALSSGMMTGTYEETVAPTGSFVLKKQDGVVGFYQSTDATRIPANRCYLTADGISAKAFYFNEPYATGIGAVNAMPSSEEIYYINGRRVAKTVKGLYIVNGKKVLIK